MQSGPQDSDSTAVEQKIETAHENIAHHDDPEVKFHVSAPTEPSKDSPRDHLQVEISQNSSAMIEPPVSLPGGINSEATHPAAGPTSPIKHSQSFSDPQVYCSKCQAPHNWKAKECSQCATEFSQFGITIRVIQARYLQPQNFNGSVDPVCLISLAQTGQPLVEFKTPCQIKTLSPVWNAEFVHSVLPHLALCELNVQVFSSGIVTDARIGDVKIDLRESLGRRWYRLSNALGEIQLEILPSSEARPLGEGHRFKVHFDKVAGTILAAGKIGSVLSSIGSTMARKFSKPAEQKTESPIGVPPEAATKQGSSWHSYRTFSVQLNYIQEVFGDKRQSWNKKYDAAIRIFGSGPTSMMMRMGIVAEHKSLFSTIASQAGTVYCGEEFLNLMNYGLLEGKRRRYTYVIVGSRMIWAETSGSFAKDMLSKHAVLANAAVEVVYSGEFFIVNSPTRVGEYELVIDNNSGTYAPSADDLPKVQELLERNFPDIVTHAITPQDPKMAVYRQILSEFGATTTGFLGRHRPRVLSMDEKQSILQTPIVNLPTSSCTSPREAVTEVAETVSTTDIQPTSEPVFVDDAQQAVLADVPVQLHSVASVAQPTDTDNEVGEALPQRTAEADQGEANQGDPEANQGGPEANQGPNQAEPSEPSVKENEVTE